MKTFCMMVVLMCACIWNTEAQKLKGDLSVLKNEARVNLVFNYEGVTIDGEGEATYVERNAKEKGEGDIQGWKDNWYGKFREEIYRTEFTKYMNAELKKLEGGVFDNTPYTLIVKLNDMDPGNFAGPFSNPCKLTGVITLVKTGTTEALATLSFKKVCGNAFQAQTERRIGSSFGVLGKVTGKVIAKEIK